MEFETGTPTNERASSLEQPPRRIVVQPLHPTFVDESETPLAHNAYDESMRVFEFEQESSAAAALTQNEIVHDKTPTNKYAVVGAVVATVCCIGAMAALFAMPR